MQNLITTNIRIPEDDFIRYRELAENQDISFAALVRNALSSTYSSSKSKKKKKKSFWDVEKYAISIPGLKKGESIDEVIYARNPHGK